MTPRRTTPTLALLEFESGMDYHGGSQSSPSSPGSHGNLLYSEINSEESQAIIQQFIAANTPEAMPEEAFNVLMFGKLAEATTQYNQIFDNLGTVDLRDDNGKPIAVLFNNYGYEEALWARDLTGASIDIVAFSQKSIAGLETDYISDSLVIETLIQRITFTATHAQWMEGVTWFPHPIVC